MKEELFVTSDFQFTDDPDLTPGPISSAQKGDSQTSKSNFS